MVGPAFYIAIFLLFTSASVAYPVAPGKRNIKDKIITLDEKAIVVSRSDLPFLDRETFQPTKQQAAGISKSKLGFIRTSTSGTGVTLPPIKGIEFTAKLKGSVTFKGSLANTMEQNIEELARSTSSDFYSFYRNERKNLQARAGGGFFSFFQAAANYGYTDDKTTRETVTSSDYESFSDRSRMLLNNTESQELVASYDTVFKGVSSGEAGTIRAFGYIQINQLTLDSGKILNVIKNSPELVVADQDGDVLGTVPEGEVDVRPNINDSIIDTELS